MTERLDAIEKRYNELTEELTKPEVLSNINKTRELSKESSELEDTVICYRKYKKVLEDINSAKEMLKDQELMEFAKEELQTLEEEKQNLEKELEILLIPKDPNDGKNVIVEIRGAAGGDEANIFAGDLYRMYYRYAEKQGFKDKGYRVIVNCGKDGGQEVGHLHFHLLAGKQLGEKIV